MSRGMELRQYVEIFNRVAAQDGLDAGIAAVVEAALTERAPLRHSAIVAEAAEEVLKAIETGHRLSAGAIRGRARTQMVTAARLQAYRTLHEMGFSYGDIGRFCGGRNHSTIISGVRAARARDERMAEARRVADAAMKPRAA